MDITILIVLLWLIFSISAACSSTFLYTIVPTLVENFSFL